MLRSTYVLIGALLMISTVGASSTVGAQSGGSKQIVSGQTVNWSAEWSLDPDVSVQESGVELVALSRGTAVVGYGGTSFPIAASQVRDLLLDGFAGGATIQQIDRGSYDNVSYSIDLAISDGGKLAIFTLVIEHPASTSMSMLLSSPDSFGDVMAAAQTGITIDGLSIFDGVDASQMQATILAAQGTNSTARTAPTPSSGSTQPPVASGGQGDELTDQEKTYLQSLNADATEMASIMQQLGPLFQQAGQNPAVVFDTIWKTELAALLVQWEAVSERAETYNPSSRQQHIHDTWLAVTRLNLSAINDIIQGVDNIDPAALSRGSARITYANLLIQDATAAINQFKIDPNAPFTPQHALYPVAGCEPFPSYDEAQQYYAAYPEAQATVDPDRDGIACEVHFGRG